MNTTVLTKAQDLAKRLRAFRDAYEGIDSLGVNDLLDEAAHAMHMVDDYSTEIGQLRDMLDDARAELAAIRKALGVPYEPHQSLQERTLLAASNVQPKGTEDAEHALLAILERAGEGATVADVMDRLSQPKHAGDIAKLAEALARIEAAGDPARLSPEDHAKFCKDAHTVQSWCNADGLRRLLAAKALAPAPVKLEEFCGVMQEILETETARGTKHRIAKWTCPKCGKACSMLELDGEWCHGDGLHISFIDGERTIGCTSCWLDKPAAQAPAVVAGWQPIETAPRDGTRVLLHPAIEVADVASKGHWNAAERCWIVGGSPSGVRHTHWQPLPDAPSFDVPVQSTGGKRG